MDSAVKGGAPQEGGGLLVAIEGWDVAPWLTRFRRLAGARQVFSAQEAFVPENIAYAAVWKPKPGLLASLPKLRAVFNLGAGVDALMGDASLPEVPLCRIVDPNLTARMREYVVLNVLLHLRQVAAYRAQQQARRWQPIAQPAAEEIRVGIMGMGVLGADAAHHLAAIGFDVAGWSRSGHAIPGIASFAGAAELPAFLARTDILVVLLPLTPETRHCLNRRVFEQLRREGPLGGPVLINAGRGGLQDEAELLQALRDGTLLAASLDVFETEPLPEASAFWSLPNVIITPHVAADSTPEAMVSAVLRNIDGFERDGVLRDMVERGRGY